MTAGPIYHSGTLHTPMPVLIRWFRWSWHISDDATGTVLAEGTALTGWGAMRQRLRAEACCQRRTWVCRCDLPVQHPLTWSEVGELNARLALEKVPVTVRTDNPTGEVVLWPALALTSRQQVHAMYLVKRKTDAPVHWAGAGR